MQVQIKRQLKIELDQADITAAVKQFLADAGHAISNADLAKINFVKSPQTGLRAELSISDEIVADEPTEVKTVNTVEAVVEHAKDLGVVAEPEPTETVDTNPEPSEEANTDSEAPGEVETSTVDDVALNALDAIAEAVETAEAEPTETATADEAPRKSLFL